MFDEFSLPYLRRIKESMRAVIAKEGAPLIVFPRNAHPSGFAQVCRIGYDVVCVDWAKQPEWVLTEMSGALSHTCLMGHLDPWVLFTADRDVITTAVRRVLDAFKVKTARRGRHIFNLGHGMMPGIDPVAVQYVVEAVRQYQKEIK